MLFVPRKQVSNPKVTPIPPTIRSNKVRYLFLGQILAIMSLFLHPLYFRSAILTALFSLLMLHPYFLLVLFIFFTTNIFLDFVHQTTCSFPYEIYAVFWRLFWSLDFLLERSFNLSIFSRYSSRSTCPSLSSATEKVDASTLFCISLKDLRKF